MKSHWNERFSQEAYLYGKAPNQFIREINQKIHLKGDILAIAEGEGRNALYIAKEAVAAEEPIKIEVWDYSDVALEKINQRKEDLPIETREVDLTEVIWPENRYDAAICVYGHFAKEMQEKVFQGLRQSVKSGGWIVGEVYSEEQIPYQSGGPRNQDYLYSPSLFTKLFAEDFIRHLYVGEVMREEGALHRGICHVIQFAIQLRKA